MTATNMYSNFGGKWDASHLTIIKKTSTNYIILVT